MQSRKYIYGFIFVLLTISTIVCKVKSSKNVIQEVDRKELEKMIISEEYLAVLFYKKSCKDCDDILQELERIDDEAEDFGVSFIKNCEKSTAKMYGVISFPALVYFRNQQPSTFEGDLRDEEKVLEWLTDLDSVELPDQIEDVNKKMLGRLIEEKDFLAVLLYKENDTESAIVLQELEKIDEKADALGIDFVKIADESLINDYGMDTVPTLIYYRKGIPLLFEGDLGNEDEVLKYLLEFQDTEDELEQETESSIIFKLIEESPYLAVLFYENEDEDEDLLEELDEIDVNSTLNRITFTKLNDNKLAEKYGVDNPPALVLFDNQLPSLYTGNLSNVKEVFDWLIKQTTSDEIEETEKSDDTEDDDGEKDDDDVDDESDDAQKGRSESYKSAKSISSENMPNSQEDEDSEEIIEYVNKVKLEKLIKDIPYSAVFFYKDRCRACKVALSELEQLKDEIEDYGISVYRINERQVSNRYGINTFPALVYFRNGNPLIYDGDLTDESLLLEWLTDDDNLELLYEIETVNLKMLNNLVTESLYLAVYFYSSESEECDSILKELESIDDECLANGRSLLKISEVEALAHYNVQEVPALAMFKNKELFWYEGDFYNEEDLLEFLTGDDSIESEDRIREVSERMLKKIIDNNKLVAVFFYEDNCEECERALEELEHIDDELENSDILLLKMKDRHYAKKLGVLQFPALVYFKDSVPLVYNGNLLDEENVLEMLRKDSSSLPELTNDVYVFMAMGVGFILHTILGIYFQNKYKEE